MNFEHTPLIILLITISIGLVILLIGIIRYIKTPVEKRITGENKLPYGVKLVAAVLLMLVGGYQISIFENQFSIAAGVIWFVIGFLSLVKTAK